MNRKKVRFHARGVIGGDRHHRHLGGIVVACRSSCARSSPSMQCSNNVKQLALAMHNYHDTHRSFPAGVTAFTGMNNGAQRNNATPEAVNGFYNGMWSWSAYILPFVEGQNLYNQINFNRRPWTEESGDAWFYDTGADTTAFARCEPSGFIADAFDLCMPKHPAAESWQVQRLYAMNAGHGPKRRNEHSSRRNHDQFLLPRACDSGQRHRAQEQLHSNRCGHRRHQQHVHDPRASVDDSSLAIPHEPVYVDESPVARIGHFESRRDQLPPNQNPISKSHVQAAR